MNAHMKKRISSIKAKILIVTLCLCIAGGLAFAACSKTVSDYLIRRGLKEVELKDITIQEGVHADPDRELKRSDPEKIRILMVDDDKENQRVVDRFEKLGCDVTTKEMFERRDLDDYDALVIPGGGDVTPEVYGQKRSEYTTDTNLLKDKTQIDAVLAFANAGKPVLGICRGCQLLNVAFGGTLNQGNGVYRKGWYVVNIRKNSVFYPCFGDSLKAYYYHKQRLDRVAEGFAVTQTDQKDESIIGAIEHESLPIYGVQWHCDAIRMPVDGEKSFQVFIDKIEDTYARTASG